MPVNRKMMKNLKKEYGEKKGEDVYYAIENKRKHGNMHQKKKHRGHGAMRHKSR